MRQGDEQTGVKLRVFALVFLSLLLAASAYAAYRFQSMPDRETRFVPTLEYAHEGEYGYKVTLWPSELYENRTVLMPDEVPYIPLVHLVKVSFSYRFSSEPALSGPGNLTYRVTCSLESPNGWRKTSTLVPPTSLSFNSSTMSLTESFTFNITETEELIRAIETETRTSSPTYDLKILAHIDVTASTGSEQIQEDFEPEMTMRFMYHEGNRLSFEGLNHERRNTIGEHVVTVITWVGYARFGSYALSAVLLTTLAYTAWRTWTERKAVSPVDRAMRKHRDLIVDSAGLEEKGRERTIVRVKSVEDLAKVSEETAKPIIHEQRLRRHVFYVLDADVRYEFTPEAF